MELETLDTAMQIVELTATTRSSAIRDLVEAVNWAEEGMRSVDGSIRSASTYLIPRCHVTDLVGGLGARHQAAAAITTETQAIAVTVSQSTGTVTLFQDGNVVLTLERAAMTRW